MIRTFISLTSVLLVSLSLISIASASEGKISIQKAVDSSKVYLIKGAVRDPKLVKFGA